MTNTPKFTGLDFLQNLEPVIVADNKKYPDKSTVFMNLFKSRGVDFSAKDFPNLETDASVIHLQATRTKIFMYGYERKRENLKEIDDLLIKPENKDYLLVTLSAYIKAGGNKNNFKTELNTFKNKYQFMTQFPKVKFQSKHSERSIA